MSRILRLSMAEQSYRWQEVPPGRGARLKDANF